MAGAEAFSSHEVFRKRMHGAKQERGMSNETKRHAVDLVQDDPTRLRDRLDAISDEGSRVISIIWQPARTTTIDGEPVRYEAGYVVVSEQE